MAAEFTYNPIQTVAVNQAVILNTNIPCRKGYVLHREESGIVTLRGIVNNPYATFAQYQVTFNGNIALPEGGTPGEISLAIAIDGEPIQTSLGASTPTAAEAFNNITSPAIITVPKGCCFNITVENTSGVEIEVRNANLLVERIA